MSVRSSGSRGGGIDYERLQAPRELQPEAHAQADRIAEFARIMAEIAVGVRTPDEATK